MKFYRQNWYYFSAVLFVILVFSMGFFGHLINPVQSILIYSYMAILVHQFEEYILPGGFPYITNSLVMMEKKVPDRFPLNKKLSFTINVIWAYPFFISAIIFPNAIWLGFATVLFASVFEGIVHGIAFPIRIKKFYYNPGLAATLCLGFPIAIYYTWYVASHGLASTSDYVWGVVAFVAFPLSMSMLRLPFLKLAGRDSDLPFTQAELARGGFKERNEKI